MGKKSRLRIRSGAIDPPSRRRTTTQAIDAPTPRHSGRHQPDSGCKDDEHHDLPWSAEARDWSALPRDVWRIILSHVPQADILRAAGLVSASWRRLARDEPQLWRRIDLAVDDDKDEVAPARWQAMARAALGRSAGQCESFRGRVNGRFLFFLAHSAPLLRNLHVTSRFNMSSERVLTAVAKKLPLLEQLVLSDGLIEEAWLAALVDHCPRLQLLHADGCRAWGRINKSLRESLECRIKDLRLPRVGGAYQSYDYNLLQQAQQRHQRNFLTRRNNFYCCHGHA